MASSEHVLDDISHRRLNPLRGSWVMVSPHRTKRPWQGQEEAPSQSTLPAYDPKCYLCPNNPRAAGSLNPSYENTFVFVNDYSAVKEDQQHYVADHGGDGKKKTLLLRAESVEGKCFVICFSPKHNLTLADLTPSSITPIIKTWTMVYRSYLPRSDPNYLTPPSHIPAPSRQYTYMQIFENKGAAMGCSNPHPHGQIWITTSLPEEPMLELSHLSTYREKHGTCLLCDYVRIELSKKERTIFQNASWLAVVPWWATWPFEILLLSRSCKGCLPQLTNEEVTHLTEAISQVTKRYDNLFETSFPYSMGVHQSPLDATKEQAEASHIHIHFYPPLLRSATVRKFLVGYEMLAEPQRDITPEQAAVRLRALSGVRCYRGKKDFR